MDGHKNAKLSVTVLPGIQSVRDACLHWTKVTQCILKLVLKSLSLPSRHKMPLSYFESNAQPEQPSNVEDFTSRSTMKQWTL